MKVKTLTTTAIVCLLLAGRALSAYAQNVYANVERKTGDMVSLQVAANQRISLAADGDYVLGTYHGPYVTFTGQNVYKSVARTATMPVLAAATISSHPAATPFTTWPRVRASSRSPR